MRQPHAKRTGKESLDQCYVYCWNTSVSDAVKRVKNGLEKEGLTGIGESVWAEGEGALKPITMQRRKKYQDTEIFLPIVSHKSGDGWVELDYLRHILPNIDLEFDSRRTLITTFTESCRTNKRIRGCRGNSTTPRHTAKNTY